MSQKMANIVKALQPIIFEIKDTNPLAVMMDMNSGKSEVGEPISVQFRDDVLINIVVNEGTVNTCADSSLKRSIDNTLIKLETFYKGLAIRAFRNSNSKLDIQLAVLGNFDQIMELLGDQPELYNPSLKVAKSNYALIKERGFTVTDSGVKVEGKGAFSYPSALVAAVFTLIRRAEIEDAKKVLKFIDTMIQSKKEFTTV